MSGNRQCCFRQLTTFCVSFQINNTWQCLVGQICRAWTVWQLLCNTILFLIRSTYYRLVEKIPVFDCSNLRHVGLYPGLSRGHPQPQAEGPVWQCGHWEGDVPWEGNGIFYQRCVCRYLNDTVPIDKINCLGVVKANWFVGCHCCCTLRFSKI